MRYGCAAGDSVGRRKVLAGLTRRERRAGSYDGLVLRATGLAEQSSGFAIRRNWAVPSRRSVASGKAGFRRPSGR